ncbi:hypothetical protein Zmor_011895 [Zophobas morio]|jgi:hypothetical protein|uniref:Uncharacterized protein n=1 Tax=Zophobas morio TaxID=2755281 RepID=A0AA38HK19_9CUCU|nr:hypothetical protein Zmor_011895 [Zophobas morio]
MWSCEAEQALHDEVQTGEEILDDDEHIDEDITNYEVPDQESDTKEKLSDNENEEVDAGPWYLRRNGNTKCQMTPPKNVKTRTRNIVTHLPGVTARSKEKILL